MKKKSHWFAVYTRPKAEKKVDEQLSKAGFESFLPLQTVVKQWSDRKKKVKVPLISSFVFVRSDSKNIRNIYTVSGVVSILKYLGDYAIVKDSEIENLRIFSENEFPIHTHNTKIDLSEGTKVVVTKGPLEGLNGVYLKNAGKHRIIIEIESLNNYFEVTLPLNTVKEVLLDNESA